MPGSIFEAFEGHTVNGAKYWPKGTSGFTEARAAELGICEVSTCDYKQQLEDILLRPGCMELR